MEDYYRKIYKEHLNDFCAGCKHCDTRVLNILEPYGIYYGYDGESYCAAHNIQEPEGNNNRDFISAHWSKCNKFEPCEKYDYIKEMCIHIVYALSEFPYNSDDRYDNKIYTKADVFNTVLNLYKDTVKLYPPVHELHYDEPFFDNLVKIYKTGCEPGEYIDKIEKPIVKQFMINFYG